MSLRIMRKGATVRELEISDETVAAIAEVKKTFFGNKRRNSQLKEVLGHSLCAICDEIPDIEISYDLGGGFTKVEYLIVHHT